MSSDTARAFLALHHGPGFLLPNAWDAGSARILEQAGFGAIATTSAGIAWSLGLPDGEALDLERMLARVSDIVSAVDVPVSADLEAGYGPTPDDVHRTISLAVASGVVGGNLEDAVDGTLLRAEEAGERIAAARAAAPRGTFVINARTDAYFAGGVDDPFATTLARAARYAEAGADCVFVPGVDDAQTIGALAAELPVPLNIVAGLTPTRIPIPTLFSLGVARVSVGGSLARAAYSATARAAAELRDAGTLSFLDDAESYRSLQKRFGA